MLVFRISEFLQNVTNKLYSKYINKKQQLYIYIRLKIKSVLKLDFRF